MDIKFQVAINGDDFDTLRKQAARGVELERQLDERVLKEVIKVLLDMQAHFREPAMMHNGPQLLGAYIERKEYALQQLRSVNPNNNKR